MFLYRKINQGSSVKIKIVSVFYQSIFVLILFASLTNTALASSKELNQIPDSLIYINTDKIIEYVILVEKETQNLFIYEYDGSFKEVRKFRCSTGENTGSKLQKGDRKTPEGVYFFTDSYTKRDLTPIYGSRAFPIDYPNFMDRLAGKNGSAIWVHGTNKALKPNDTNGCVALVNKDINALSDYISLNRTPIVIQNRINYAPLGELNIKGKALFDFINVHEKSILIADGDKFFKIYNQIVGVVPIWWDNWLKARESFKSQYPDASIVLKNFVTMKEGNIYVSIFDQFLSFKTKDSDNQDFEYNKLVGTKKLFLVKNIDSWNIIEEGYQLSPYLSTEEIKDPNYKSDPEAYPIIKAANDFMSDFNRKQTITEIIDDWLDAWTKKDEERFGKYYASDFRAKGMGRKSWLSYKKRLNKIYDFIKVSRGELTIKPGTKRTRVSFQQTYISSGYKAVGIKYMIFKKEGDLWKIYRERWKKM